MRFAEESARVSLGVGGGVGDGEGKRITFARGVSVCGPLFCRCRLGG